MSFSGKKFKRVTCENLDNLVRDTNTNENTVQMLKCSETIFSFKRIDDKVFEFSIMIGSKTVSHLFTLGEEYETLRKDGSKVKITYTLEGDNVLKQMIKQPDGKISYFRREFGDKDAKMIITVEGSDVQAIVYYELVE